MKTSYFFFLFCSRRIISNDNRGTNEKDEG